MVQKYTYEKNLDLLNQNFSKSLIFQDFAKNILDAWTYFWIIYILILSLAVGLLVVNFWTELYKLASNIYRPLIRIKPSFHINLLKRKHD
jgi:hypothetical protein